MAKLEAMLNNALQSTPDFVLYIDGFKLLRVARENLKFAELLFRQAQKRYLKDKQTQAQQNSEYNAKIQVESQKSKSEADAILEDSKNKAKEKQILLTGYFDLIKSGVPVPLDMKDVLGEVVRNVAMPIALENKQVEQQMNQAYSQQEQQIEEQGQFDEQQIENEQMQQV